MSSDLPSGWAWATLPQLIARDGVLSDGDWVESKDQDPDGEVRLTQLADVGDGAFRDRSSRFLTRVKAAELGCTFLAPNDVLVARMPDPLGRACVFPGSKQACVTVVDVCIVRPKTPWVQPRWIMHFINAPATRIAIGDLQRGSTRKRISKANLCTIPLPVPPSVEQQRLSEALDSYLSRLDETTTLLDRVQHNMKRYRASVLKAAVEGRLVPTEAELARAEKRDYEPASVLLKRILTERRQRREKEGRLGKYEEPQEIAQTQELAELPDGWQWASLDSVAGIQLGQQRAPIHADAEVQVPYVRAANITWGGLDLSDVKTMGFIDRERYSLEYGDVLLSEASGSPMEAGKPAIWRNEILGACYQKTLLRIRPYNKNTLLPEFLRLVFLRDCLTGKFARLAPGVGIVHLTAERMHPWAVPLPPTDEQRRIVAEVDRLETAMVYAVGSVRQQELRCTRLRQSILKWAFEGKLVDQDPNDEPASALLARIKSEQSTTTAKAAPRRRAKTE